MGKMENFTTGKIKEKSEIGMVNVTPALAERWLNVEMWDRQRKLRTWHVEELAEAMRRGEFTEGTQIHFACFNGKSYNINGQHTLNAIKKANCPIKLSVLYTEVESEREIAELFSRHDRHLQRTTADAHNAFGLCDRFKMTQQNANAVGRAVRVVEYEFPNSLPAHSYRTRSNDEQVRLFEKYGTAANAFFESIKGATSTAMTQMRSQSVLAVAIKSFQEYPDYAGDFWSQVALGNGLTIGDPRKTLMNWLIDTPARKQNIAARSRICARAWNAWVAGETMTRFRTPDITKPVILNAR